MEKINLGLQANVIWHAQEVPEGTIAGGETQHFGELRDAIKFVMEEIPESIRNTAWINHCTGQLTYEQIRLIHTTYRYEARWAEV